MLDVRWPYLCDVRINMFQTDKRKKGWCISNKVPFYYIGEKTIYYPLAVVVRGRQTDWLVL